MTYCDKNCYRLEHTFAPVIATGLTFLTYVPPVMCYDVWEKIYFRKEFFMSVRNKKREEPRRLPEHRQEGAQAVGVKSVQLNGGVARGSRGAFGA